VALQCREHKAEVNPRLVSSAPAGVSRVSSRDCETKESLAKRIPRKVITSNDKHGQ
jgi:hypothetical protein